MDDSFYTIVLHHPARPATCLSRALTSLRGATSSPHVVDVLVQGNEKPAALKRTGDGYELRCAVFGENLGIGGGFRQGVERFLQSDAQWLLKIDDDIAVPRYVLDVLRQIIFYEADESDRLLGAVMMATARTKVRLLSRRVSSNGVKTIKPVDGHRGRGGMRFLNYDVSWRLTDFADVGCTLYPRQLFEEGCLPDPELFVGGIGLDLVLQGTEKGYEWAVCTDPRCDHFNADCHSSSYKDIRSDQTVFGRSLAHFHGKWGLAPVPLAKAAGALRGDGRIVL